MGGDAFDWEGYWRGAVDGGPMDAMASADRVEHLVRFLDEVGPPSSFAAVGCGDGTVPAAVAAEFPDVTARGYDVSASVIARNRAEYADREPLSFAVAGLPDPGIDRRFGVVYCFATLPYVREIERAIRDLFALVEPGGYLVVNYPNEEFCETYADGIEAGSPLSERFELVCTGSNEISRQRIEALTGVRTRDYWEFVDAPEEVHGGLSWYPCVFIEKPRDD